MIPAAPPHELASRVPVLASAGHAYGTLFRQFDGLAVAIALPWAFSQLSWYLCFTFIDGSYDGFVWAFLEALPESLFAVALCRLVLLGGPENRPRLIPSPDRCHGRALAVLLILTLTWFPQGLLEHHLGDIDGASFAIHLNLVFSALAICFQYVYLRLALALPPASIGEKFSILRAWRASRGQGLRIFVASTIAYIPLAAVSVAFDRAFETWIGGEVLWPDSPWSTDFDKRIILYNAVDDLLRYLSLALDLLIVTSAFRLITGWRPGSEESLLERFE